ncbi:MAG: ATP-binding protein [Ignavibacteriales bacterium]|nr:MAG: ATP-binding protein [Ignavibacteriales bacterium]
MKKRYLFNEIARYLDHKNALVITGMRQVGKTTLMKQLFETVSGPKLWFDLENPLEMKIFENIDYDGIYQELLRRTAVPERERLFVFIDEIQNLPQITRVIKYLLDKYGVKFIVTGSSNYYLRNLFPESLSGRKFLFVLPPMDFQEILYFKDKAGYIQREENTFDPAPNNMIDYKRFEGDYNEYLEFGGLPEVVLTPDVKTKKEVLNNIFTSFFQKDLRLLADITDVRELRDLILLLVPRTGNIIEITKLSSALGITRQKVYNYLEFLQGIFFIRLVPKFSSSVDRAVAGGKKVYFADNGILNTIGRVNDGQLFENAVANQLARYGELSYYNKRNSAEIDFILNKEAAIEVKLNGSRQEYDKLVKLSASLGIGRNYLISLKNSDSAPVISPQYI